MSASSAFLLLDSISLPGIYRLCLFDCFNDDVASNVVVFIFYVTFPVHMVVGVSIESSVSSPKVSFFWFSVYTFTLGP